MPNKKETALSLLQQCSGASIASISEGKAEASYAPFIWMDDKLYLLISELASHTENLRSSRSCSVLLLEEDTLSSPSRTQHDRFARTRMTLETEATFIPRDNKIWDQALKAFSERHGKTAQLLAELPDFHLVALNISSGSLVEGFGQAFSFKGTHFEKARGVSRR